MFQTYRFDQTILSLTQISLLLKEQSDQDLHCMLSNRDNLQTFSVNQMDFIKFKDEYLLHKDSIKCVHSWGNYGNPSIQLKQVI